jgi:hypothetical protein
MGKFTKFELFYITKCPIVINTEHTSKVFEKKLKHCNTIKSHEEDFA